MTPPGRRWRRGAGAATLASLAGAVVLSSGLLSRPMIFPGCGVPLPAPGAALPGGGAVVAYATADGLALRGALVRAVRPAGAPPGPVAVYFHGNAESAAQNLDVGAALAGRGVDVLVAEYRGYGGLPGAPSEEGLLRDARAALACAAAATGVAEGRLLLVGRSLGTGVAAAMAAEGRGRAAVLVSPYTSILDLAAALVSWPVARLAVVDTFRSLERLRAAAQPVTIVHGTADTVIPFAHGQALADALGARARLVPVPGRGHDDVLLDLEVLVREVTRADVATR